MPKEYSRGNRVANLVAQEMAVLIQQELKDPRLGMITINDVKISRDIGFADIYFTVLPDEKSEESEEILNGAGGYLRTRLAKRISLRTTPSLRFHYDNTINHGAQLSRAINEAIASDQNKCRSGK